MVGKGKRWVEAGEGVAPDVSRTWTGCHTVVALVTEAAFPHGLAPCSFLQLL